MQLYRLSSRKQLETSHFELKSRDNECGYIFRDAEITVNDFSRQECDDETVFIFRM